MLCTLFLLNDFFPDSITVQAVQSECERQIEAVYSAMSILEVCVKFIIIITFDIQRL